MRQRDEACGAKMSPVSGTVDTETAAVTCVVSLEVHETCVAVDGQHNSAAGCG